jgi:hypothetical protein
MSNAQITSKKSEIEVKLFESLNKPLAEEVGRMRSANRYALPALLNPSRPDFWHPTDWNPCLQALRAFVPPFLFARLVSSSLRIIMPKEPEAHSALQGRHLQGPWLTRWRLSLHSSFISSQASNQI